MADTIAHICPGCGATSFHPTRPTPPAPLPMELDLFIRVSRLETLLLELTRHVEARRELSITAECAIEEIKRLYPGI